MPSLSNNSCLHAKEMIDACWFINDIAQHMGVHKATIYSAKPKHIQSEIHWGRSQKQDRYIINQHWHNRFLLATTTAAQTVHTNRPTSANTVWGLLKGSQAFYVGPVVRTLFPQMSGFMSMFLMGEGVEYCVDESVIDMIVSWNGIIRVNHLWSYRVESAGGDDWHQ